MKTSESSTRKPRRPDLRKYAKQGSFIAKLKRVKDGMVFRHCNENKMFMKDCDAYQTGVADGKEAILAPNDLVEVLPRMSGGVV